MRKTLKEEAPSLWTVDHDLKLGPGFVLPTRMTVAKLANGELVLISPIPIDAPLGDELSSLGEVTHVVAPNRFHHLHVPATLRRYPHATVWGDSGLAKKHPTIPFRALDFAGCPELQETLVTHPIEGASKLSETVLLHPSSHTLIVTDLVFNIREPRTWFTSFVLSMMGTKKKLARSRAFGFLVDDRAASRSSTESLFDWDFDRLIVAHGENIATGAKALLASVLAPDRSSIIRAPSSADVVR